MEIKEESITTPQILGYLSEEAIQTGMLEYIDGLYAFGIEGTILASAISMINKKPIVTRDVIEMLKVDTIQESINLIFITFSVEDYEEIINEIKCIRGKGIKLDTLISVIEVPEYIQKKLRILGINCIHLYDDNKQALKFRLMFLK